MKEKDLRLYTNKRVYIYDGDDTYRFDKNIQQKKVKNKSFPFPGVYYEIKKDFYIELNKKVFIKSNKNVKIPIFPSRNRNIIIYLSTGSVLFDLYVKYISLHLGITLNVSKNNLKRFFSLEKLLRRMHINPENYIKYCFFKTKNFLPNVYEIINSFKYYKSKKYDFDVYLEYIKDLSKDEDLTSDFSFYKIVFNSDIVKAFYTKKIPKIYFDWYDGYDVWNKIVIHMIILDKNPFLRRFVNEYIQY